jgi:hypothetical protein
MRRRDAVELDDMCPKEVLQRHAHSKIGGGFVLISLCAAKMSALKEAYL